MPRDLKRYYGFDHLHFVTFSCYRRRPLLGTPRRRALFLRALDDRILRLRGRQGTRHQLCVSA